MPASRSPLFALRLAAGAILWWLLGAFLLALTPLPAHTDTLGWTPLYWLLLAPPCVLAGLRLRRLAVATPLG
ncbi:MAG TPA: hypothetical protein VGU03_13440 [Frateuria sp.]|uniref:hypothetical protein n=1 Tax=Frateuria sp. TaxID=2211372 RepID=UPI002DEB1A56|nr:hypothetical protein [Frateuria sp.]